MVVTNCPTVAVGPAFAMPRAVMDSFSAVCKAAITEVLSPRAFSAAFPVGVMAIFPLYVSVRDMLRVFWTDFYTLPPPTPSLRPLHSNPPSPNPSSFPRPPFHGSQRLRSERPTITLADCTCNLPQVLRMCLGWPAARVTNVPLSLPRSHPKRAVTLPRQDRRSAAPR